MNTFNKKNYSPWDDDSDTGFRRPPKDPACVCDYFAAIMGVPDEGEFSHSEMGLLLSNPDEFFKEG